MTYRSVFIDPDFRPRPKTNFFCVRCQKDLKENQNHRFIAYEIDCFEAIHSDDWEEAEKEIKSRRAKHLNPFIVEPVGMDCAKKIGIDYTRAQAHQ